MGKFSRNWHPAFCCDVCASGVELYVFGFFYANESLVKRPPALPTSVSLRFRRSIDGSIIGPGDLSHPILDPIFEPGNGNGNQSGFPVVVLVIT